MGIMKLIYTTSVKTGQVQDRPENSLGGFVSSSIIPNTQLSSLFSDLSFNMVDNDIIEYIGIVLKNDSKEDYSSINMWIETEADSIVKIEVGATDLIDDQMQQLFNNQSAPYDVDFYEANSAETSVDLGTCEAGGIIGLWLKRSVLQDKVKEQNTTTYLQEHFGEEVKLKEKFIIHLTPSTIYGDSIGSLNI